MRGEGRDGRELEEVERRYSYFVTAQMHEVVHEKRFHFSQKTIEHFICEWIRDVQCYCVSSFRKSTYIRRGEGKGRERKEYKNTRSKKRSEGEKDIPLGYTAVDGQVGITKSPAIRVPYNEKEKEKVKNKLQKRREEKEGERGIPGTSNSGTMRTPRSYA